MNPMALRHIEAQITIHYFGATWMLSICGGRVLIPNKIKHLNSHAGVSTVSRSRINKTSLALYWDNWFPFYRKKPERMKNLLSKTFPEVIIQTRKNKKKTEVRAIYKEQVFFATDDDLGQAMCLLAFKMIGLKLNKTKGV